MLPLDETFEEPVGEQVLRHASHQACADDGKFEFGTRLSLMRALKRNLKQNATTRLKSHYDRLTRTKLGEKNYSVELLANNKASHIFNVFERY
jgi:hypothetical protein